MENNAGKGIVMVPLVEAVSPFTMLLTVGRSWSTPSSDGDSNEWGQSELHALRACWLAYRFRVERQLDWPC